MKLHKNGAYQDSFQGRPNLKDDSQKLVNFVEKIVK